MKHYPNIIAEPEVHSPQWIFNRVVAHIRRQRRQCRQGEHCFYRLGEDQCPVGPLIHRYDPEMEGYKVPALLEVFRMPKWFRDNAALLEDLQAIHDSPTNWPIDRQLMVLELYAKEHGLRMPERF